jgi:predicted metalloprotease with PDZ domain
VRPYTRADVVGGLRAVAPIDWEAFLAERVDGIAPRAPLAGIERSGWRLVFDDEPNEYLSALEKVTKTDNLSLSLGLWSKADGFVADVVHGSPAFAAGVAPGMRLLAIGGRKWTAAIARDVLVKAERAAEPIELVVESADLVRVVRVDYHGGLRNPRLVRDASRPDLLSRILTPRVPAAEDPRRRGAPDQVPGPGRWPLPRSGTCIPPM